MGSEDTVIELQSILLVHATAKGQLIGSLHGIHAHTQYGTSSSNAQLSGSTSTRLTNVQI